MNYAAMMQLRKSGEKKIKEGDYAEAERFYKSALQEVELQKLPNNYTLQQSKILAVFYLAVGEYEKAETFLKQAVSLESNLDGPKSLTMAKHLTDLGLLYHFWNKYEEAERVLQHALQIEEKASFSKYPTVDQNLNCLSRYFLALVYCEQGKVNEASQLCKLNAEKIIENIGPGGRDLGLDMYKTAFGYCDKGHHAEAKKACSWLIHLRFEQLQQEYLGTALPKAGKGNYLLKPQIAAIQAEYELFSMYEEIWRPNTIGQMASGRIPDYIQQDEADRLNDIESFNKLLSDEEFYWRPAKTFVSDRN